MSLFAALRNAPAVFQQVLDHFFSGENKTFKRPSRPGTKEKWKIKSILLKIKRLDKNSKPFGSKDCTSYKF